MRNRGTLVLDSVTLLDNRAAGDGGAGFSAGGAVTIVNSTFAGNSAARGGAVATVAGRLKVTNADPEKGHDVSVEGVGASDTLAQGESFTLTFTRAGTYTLVCTIHPGMDATVTVR